MSKARWFLRLLLVVIAAAVVFAGYRTIARNQPGYYWRQAQKALEAGDRDSAKVHLLNLLKREPRHGEGHLAMAEIVLEEAAAAKAPAAAQNEKSPAKADAASLPVEREPAGAPGKPSGLVVRYARHPIALHHLVEAGKASPDALELQKQVVIDCLAAGQMANAAAAAARVIDAEPDHGDALFALAWQAVERGNSADVQRFLEKLGRVPTRRPFATHLLALQYTEKQKQPDRAQKVLAQAAQTASQLTPKQYRSLAETDVETMPALLIEAVRRAPDAAEASRRAVAAVAGLETAVKAWPEWTGRAAETASKIALLVASARPTGPAAEAVPEPKSDPTALADLAQRAERLRAAAIEAGVAAPVVYHQSAAAALARGDVEASLVLLGKGLQAGAKLPSERRAELLELRRLAAWELVMLRRFAEAEGHIKVLLASGEKTMMGWGHLLSGRILAAEGKLEKARDHLIRARSDLGDLPQVRAALANVYLAMGQWREALPHLEALHVPPDALTPEERAWRDALVGSEDRIHLAELRARLGLNQWSEAQRHLESLGTSKLAPQAESLAVAWLVANGRLGEATQRLADARRRFPRHWGLVDLESALLDRAGRGDEARGLVEQFAAAAPDDLDVQLALCVWRLRHKDADKALAHLAELAKRPAKKAEDPLRIKAIQAQALLAAGKPKEAETVAAALRADPRSAAIGGLMDALAQWKQNHPQEAADALAAVRKMNPRSGLLSLFQGEAELAQGDHAEGIEHLAKALEVTALRQRAGAALLGSVARLAAEKPLKEVEAKVDALLRQSPDDPVLVLAKADLAIRQGRLDEGIEQLDRVERLEPASPAGPYFKGLALRRAGQQDRAASEVRRALARDPKHLPSLVLAARVALAKGDPAQALIHARAALALRPALPEAVLAEAEALRRMDRADEARRAVENLIAAQPKLPAGYAALAALHAAAGRTDEALEAYRQGLERLPNHPALRLGQIALLARSNRVADAQEAARQAVGEKPKSAMLLAVATVFAAEGRLAEARPWCEKAIDAGDAREKTAARFLLGNMAVHEAGERGDKNRLAEARDHFAAVVAAEPAHLIAANNLAWLLATEFGQAAEAVAVLEKAKGPASVRQIPAAVAHTLAVAYRKAGRGDEALRVLDEALAVHPNDAALLIEIGAILAERQRWIEARTVLERAKKLGLSDDQSAEAGQILAKIETSTALSP